MGGDATIEGYGFAIEGDDIAIEGWNGIHDTWDY